MSSLFCVLLWALLIPLAAILWLTESRQARIKRLRRLGWSQRRISEHLRCTTYQVRKALA